MKQLYFVLIMAIPLLASGQEMVRAQVEGPAPVAKGFKLFPNPAYGDEVHITSAIDAIKDIEIFDLFGERVLNKKLDANTLNIAGLLPGVYVLQLTQNEKVMTRRLVVKSLD